MDEEKKPPKIIQISAEDLKQHADEIPFTERFIPIEETHRIRTINSQPEENLTIFQLELVNKNYQVMQTVFVGKDDKKISKIKKQLLELGLRKKVVKAGIKEFKEKYKDAKRKDP